MRKHVLAAFAAIALLLALLGIDWEPLGLFGTADQVNSDELYAVGSDGLMVAAEFFELAAPGIPELREAVGEDD